MATANDVSHILLLTRLPAETSYQQSLTPVAGRVIQDIAGDIELGLWGFWVPTSIGLAATISLTVYSMRIYHELAEEEQDAELAVVKEKKRLGLVLTKAEVQMIRKDERQKANLAEIKQKKEQGERLTQTELRMLQAVQRKEERKQRKGGTDVEEREEMVHR